MSNMTDGVIGTAESTGVGGPVGVSARGGVDAGKNHGAAHAIRRAFLMDWHKLTSQGWQWIPMLVIGLPAMMLAITMFGGGDFSSGAFGGLYGSFLYVYVLIPMYAFMYEERDHGMWLNGIMPVSRAHQVVARYLLMFVSAALLLVSYLLAWAALAAGGAGNVGSAWTSIFAFLWAYLITQSVMCPVFYRFGTQKALVWFAVIAMVAFCAIMGGLALAATLLPQGSVDGWVGSVLAFVTTVASRPMPLILIGVVTAALALAVSFRVSVRIYQAKEL